MVSDGYLRRHIAHYRGAGDAAVVGLLDIIQTYVLEALSREGYFDRGLVFKGGTALRKFFLGPAGRFSTDLDFVVSPGSQLREEILLWLSEGFELFDVSCRISLIDDRRGALEGSTPLGDIEIRSMVEFSDRGTWLRPVLCPPIEFAFHDGLEFDSQSVPIAEFHEILAEKLAAIWRRGHARDLYDLAFLGRRALNESLLRRLTFLKVYADVAEGISRGPFDPEELISSRLASVTGWNDLGLLSAPPDPTSLTREVVNRYGFLGEPNAIEQTISRTSLSDRNL
ncbi:MAG: nucleotidyl transferase AbiEii/AbiGii toxin family protein, partial [Anaerolineales bacterium]